jgi:uroporphyrinogen decarboxylase
MTSRERVHAALRHEETDYPPRVLYGEAIGYVPAVKQLLSEKCGALTPLEYFAMDITGINRNPSSLSLERFSSYWDNSFDDAVAGGEIDEWGVWWRKGDFYHFAHIESPLKNAVSVSEVEKYPWPDVEAEYRYAGLQERVNYLHQKGLAVCAFAGSIFEQAWFIRGMENLMADMLINPDMADCILGRAAECQRQSAVAFAKAGADIIITGDDVASQNNLMMSIDTWRKFLKERQKKTVLAAKEAASEVKVFYHSDGNIAPLIPDIIETGIDILNPLQPECVDPAEIKQLYGEQLSFWGSVSVQNSLSHGTPGQVRREVLERRRTVGKNGGFILAPAHVLSPETPWENIVEFFAAATEVL